MDAAGMNSWSRSNTIFPGFDLGIAGLSIRSGKTTIADTRRPCFRCQTARENSSETVSTKLYRFYRCQDTTVALTPICPGPNIITLGLFLKNDAIGFCVSTRMDIDFVLSRITADRSYIGLFDKSDFLKDSFRYLFGTLVQI